MGPKYIVVSSSFPVHAVFLVQIMNFFMDFCPCIGDALSKSEDMVKVFHWSQ